MTIHHTGLSEAVLSYRAPDPLVEEFVPEKDRASFADPSKKSLLQAATRVQHLTPYIGTQLEGIQLSQLTSAQKDELALLAAERGVVFFRNQDLTLDRQHKLAEHYGKQDRDPNQVDPRHVTIIGREADGRDFAAFGAEFHADHSFEANPPSYTLLRMVKTPDYGGDTIYTSATALYDKLSPHFQNLFDGLQAVHTSEHSYINAINGGGKTFRPPVRRQHPLVRTHPVTHMKSLFYNPAFVLHLEGLKSAEAQHTLDFLREHVHSSDDLTVRWKWEAGSVAFWDNRVVVHRAIPGGYDPQEREGKRTAVFGEKPFLDKSKGVTLSQYASRATNGLDSHSNGETGGKTHANGTGSSTD